MNHHTICVYNNPTICVYDIVVGSDVGFLDEGGLFCASSSSTIIIELPLNIIVDSPLNIIVEPDGRSGTSEIKTLPVPLLE